MKMKTVISRLPAALAAVLLISAAVPPGAAADEPDSAMVLEGGSEGTVFKRMTVEGKDLFRIEFERPRLQISLDPASAPGLDWDNTWDVVAEGDIDLRSPLAGLSASESSPYLPRPWLEEYRTGDIVRFRPSLSGVERWRLTIADPRVGEVRAFEGTGDPPDIIGWDGLSGDGSPMPPGYTYSYVVEAWDRAGNRRNFVGKGFQLPSYMVESGGALHFLLPGSVTGDRQPPGRRGRTVPHSAIIEAASRINQHDPEGRIVSIRVTARNYDQARGIAESLAGELGSMLLGDPATMRYETDVRDDAPGDGTIAITVEKAG
jgi:hypothetical protein